MMEVAIRLLLDQWECYGILAGQCLMIPVVFLIYVDPLYPICLGLRELVHTRRFPAYPPSFPYLSLTLLISALELPPAVVTPTPSIIRLSLIYTPRFEIYYIV